MVHRCRLPSRLVQGFSDGFRFVAAQFVFDPIFFFFVLRIAANAGRAPVTSAVMLGFVTVGKTFVA